MINFQAKIIIDIKFIALVEDCWPRFDNHIRGSEYSRKNYGYILDDKMLNSKRYKIVSRLYI